MVQHFYHCVQLLPHWHHTTKMVFKRCPRVFGSFLHEVEGDERSSSGSKCPAATCMLSNIPPTPAEHTCRVASICWHPKMLPRATSPSHRNLAVIFTQVSSCSFNQKAAKAQGLRTSKIVLLGVDFVLFRAKTSGLG